MCGDGDIMWYRKEWVGKGSGGCDVMDIELDEC